MNPLQRNNVRISGDGRITLVFAHGLGCDQKMWQYLLPAFENRYRTVVFDLVGCGASDWSAYDFEKYGSLHGYAKDVLDIIEAVSDEPVVYVGHSVSGMIGLLASIKAPDKFAAQVMIGSSPCYLNDGDYQGGFSSEDIAELCRTMDSNYLSWASTMAPAFMGAPQRPDLIEELTLSFRRTDPHIARHFARVTFELDHRAALTSASSPTLILQSSDDFVVPVAVGDYMQRHMPQARLATVTNIGHFPHVSAPGESASVINKFLHETGFQ